MTAADLAALARFATPGPWCATEGNFIAQGEHGPIVAEVPCQGANDADVAFIAAWNPQRALAALAVIDAAQTIRDCGVYYDLVRFTDVGVSHDAWRTMREALSAWALLNWEPK